MLHSANANEGKCFICLTVQPGDRLRSTLGPETGTADPSKQFCNQTSVTLETFWRAHVCLLMAPPGETQSLRFYPYELHFGHLCGLLISRMLTIRRKRHPLLRIQQQLLNYARLLNYVRLLNWRPWLKSAPLQN